MKRQLKIIKDLFLLSPETGEKLFISSDLIDNKDGSYSFYATDEKTNQLWKHTIRTEECPVEQS